MQGIAFDPSRRELPFGFKRKTDLSFNEAVAHVVDALKEEGFGILSEIRMDEKFREKLSAEFRKYLILGACNPALAYQTVLQEIDIGLLLPCNVIVYEDDDKHAVVAAIDAEAMLSVIGDRPEIKTVAKQVNEKLQRVISEV